MRVLWLCNIILPAAAKSLGLDYSNREGWLSGIYDRMRKMNGIQSDQKEVELGICFPAHAIPALSENLNGKFMLEDTICYIFEEDLSRPERYEPKLEEHFKEIIQDFRPDMVHIFGTEFPHALAMARAYGKPERILVGIQGLCTACAQTYMADIPSYVRRRVTFRDFVRKDSVERQQEKFLIRGAREQELLKLTGHITGRTEFDKAETAKINPKASYHFMNETMRAPFYEGIWTASECIPHSIFLSQGDYPLKGFHYLLKAMPHMLQNYPDACVYLSGTSIIDYHSVKDRMKISSYGKYLRELIRQNGLEDKVILSGRLSDVQMKEQFLKSSVFVCPSAVENSPNSLCEAMLLGVPAVAADTGGIPSLIKDGEEGILYEGGNVEKLAEAVTQVWMNPEKAILRAIAARKRAMQTHDPEKNFERLIAIYREICL